MPCKYNYIKKTKMCFGKHFATTIFYAVFKYLSKNKVYKTSITCVYSAENTSLAYQNYKRSLSFKSFDISKQTIFAIENTENNQDRLIKLTL